MHDNRPPILVILAGGQSARMGSDKALITFGDMRLIDHQIHKYAGIADHILLSAKDDLGTGLTHIADDPDMPKGPVGGIYSIAAKLVDLHPSAAGFLTIPVDAPFISTELLGKLAEQTDTCLAQCDDQLHPTIAYWRSDIVNTIRKTHDLGERSPSLRWLARQCGAESLVWPDPDSFTNINTPEDLVAAATRIKKAGA
ncbi:molybdenum cofactor guanylyltransferase [Parasphingorhabdus sp.]|jgi:molybdopterin-guanine dinucleotide biosynthesis protein A|uniref:molybdenum cofactor guanylyltransferase n=1 Tax=Parasphingorhabdus sp. TaxID=2709688 RepID=UPI003D28289C